MHLMTPRDMLRHNSHLVLRLFKNNEELSRADVARQIGCSRSTVSNIIQYLEEHNLVVSCGAGNEGVGRTSTLYRFNAQARFGIGVEVTKKHLSFAMADLQGNIEKTKVYKLKSWSPKEVGREINESSHDFLDGLSVLPESILGIGVMIPGPVSDRGKVMRSVPLSWPVPTSFLEIIKDKSLPDISIINDANGKALAEACFNKDNESGSIIYLDNHNGFGSGFVDSQLNLLYGSTATAMEVGKMFVNNGVEFAQADSFLIIRDDNRLSQLKEGFEGLEDSPQVQIVSNVFAQIISQLSALFNPEKIILDVPYICSDRGLDKINNAVSEYIHAESLISRPYIELPVVKYQNPALGGIAHSFLQSSFDFVFKPSF